VSGSYDKTIKVWDASASERELESTAVIRQVGGSHGGDFGRFSAMGVGGLATKDSDRTGYSGGLDSGSGSRPRRGRRFSFSGHAIQPGPSVASVGRSSSPSSPATGSVSSGGQGLMGRVIQRAQEAAGARAGAGGRGGSGGGGGAGKGALANVGKSSRSLAAQFAHSLH